MLLVALGFIADETQGFGEPALVAVEDLHVAGYSDFVEGKVELDISGGRYWLPETDLERLKQDPSAFYTGIKREERFTLRVLGAIPEPLATLAFAPTPPLPPEVVTAALGLTGAGRGEVATV